MMPDEAILEGWDRYRQRLRQYRPPVSHSSAGIIAALLLLVASLKGDRA